MLPYKYSISKGGIVTLPMDYSRLFSLMQEKGLTTYQIRKNNIISQSTLQKLREGKCVTTDAIGSLCKELHCQPGDIMRYFED